MSTPDSGAESIRPRKRPRSLLPPAILLLALVPAAAVIVAAYAYAEDSSDRTK
jgi:hypothetical protein